LIAGVIPAYQLPSYVDDVLEFSSIITLPAVGESGKIYVTLDTNKTYRWTGSTYASLDDGIVLGETSSTAYRGDRGKIAYDHSLIISGNPHNVTKTDVGLGNVDNTTDLLKPISNAAQSALDLKAPLANPVFTGTVSGITKSMVGLGNVPNLDFSNPVNITQDSTHRFATDVEKAAWNAGLVEHKWHHIIATATYLGPTGTTARNVFNSPNSLTLDANTFYEFEMQIFAQSSASSNIISMNFAGTLGLAQFTYFAMLCRAAAYSTSTVQYTNLIQTTAPTPINSSVGGGFNVITIKGSFFTTTAGTLTPQINFTLASGYTLDAGSYIIAKRVGLSANSPDAV